MPSKNANDIEIGSKVENVSANDKVESVSGDPNAAPVNASPTTITTPTAVIVVADAKSTPSSDDLANTMVTTTNGNNSNSKTITPAITGETAFQMQEQTKQESTVMQPIQQQSIAGKMDEDAALSNFKVLYVVAQLCGITMIVLVICLINIHLGGVGWTANPKIEFNWHPILMTIGLIFLYGNSILIYRGFRNINKKTLKQTHAAIHLVAFVCTVIGLVTAFDSHNLAVPPIPNMYSLHSWLGMGTVIVFGLQYVAGFTAYLAPGWRQALKVSYMPLHIYFGLFGFVLAIATALMGLTEKALWAIGDYSSFSNAGVMTNTLGCLYVIFGALVVYMVTESSYKRKPLPEDVILLTGANQ